MSNRIILRFIGDDTRLDRTIRKVQSGLGDVASSTAKWGSVVWGAAAVTAPAALAASALAFGGLGIAIAAQNEKVQASFTGLKDHVVSELKSMAAPFEPVLLRISNLARSTFDKIGPALREGFSVAAPYVERLAGGLSELVVNIMPGLLASLRAAEPVINVLATGFGQLGTGVSQMFSAISVAGGPASIVLQSLLNIVIGLLPVLGQLIADAATGLAPVLRDLTPIVLLLAQTVGRVLGEAFKQLGPPISNLIFKLQPLIAFLLPKIGDLIVGVVIPALAGFIQWLADSVDSIQDFAMNTVTGFLAVSHVALGFASTFLEVMGKVFYGLSLMGGAFGERMGQAARATMGAKQQVDNLRGTVAQLHGKSVEIAAHTRGTREVADLVRQIGLIPAVRTVTVNAVARVSSLVGGIFGRGRAVGGTVNKGQTYLVGERGPEYVTMGGSGNVTPNHKLGGGSTGGRGGATVAFRGNVDSAFATAFMKLVREGKIVIA